MKRANLLTLALLCVSINPTLADDGEVASIYEYCSADLNGTDCIKYPYETCLPQVVDIDSQEEALVCTHKYLLPLESSEIFPSIFLPVLLGLSSVAGIGGGSVVVPFAVGFFHFNSKEAIAISTCIVLEAAIIRFVFFSAWTKHPEAPEKTEIDYNTVKVVYPLFLVASFFGVIVYIVLSELWLTVFIITCLGTTAIQSTYKGIQKFRAESVKIAEEQALKGDFISADSATQVEIDSKKEPVKYLKEEKEEDHKEMKEGLLEKQITEADRKALEEIQARERTVFSQWRVQVEVFGLTLLSVVVNLFRGSPKNESFVGMETCGAPSWSLLAAFIIVCSLVAWKNVKQVRKELDIKKKFDALCPSDVDISQSSLLFWVIAMGFLGSLLGNALGLGGGFLYNPAQIALGVAPSVAASTSMYMIMLAAAASTSLLVIFGQVNGAYVFYLMISCGLGVILGMSIIGKLLKRWKRQSIVAICLGLILTLATIFSGVLNVSSLIQQKQNGLDIMQGSQLC